MVSQSQLQNIYIVILSNFNVEVSLVLWGNLFYLKVRLSALTLWMVKILVMLLLQLMIVEDST